jgi:LysR family transcriptional regulator, hypochlorite-specific transcription factor HypT
MEIRWLEDFIALAETQHFSRAADQQNVSQPTFSRRIKLLEEEMGVQLIDRNTLPLSLTSAGESFLNAAERITRMLRETREQCQAIREHQARRLTFATSQTLYLSFYKTWLAPVCEQLKIELDLNLRSTAWTVKDFSHALLEQQCDFMLCYWHPSIELFSEATSNFFEYFKIADEVLVPVTCRDAKGHPRYQIPGTKLKPIPFIDYHDNAFLKPVVHYGINHSRHDIHLKTINQNFHSVSVKAMIKEGFGMGWIPSRLASDSISYGRLQRAGGTEFNIPIEIRLYRRRDNDHKGLNLLWQRARSHFQSVSVI